VRIGEGSNRMDNAASNSAGFERMLERGGRRTSTIGDLTEMQVWPSK